MSGSAVLQFTAYKMYDENGSAITSTANGATITISSKPVVSPSISITDKTVTAGETVSIPVMISNSSDVYGGNFTLQYDSSLLTAESYSFGSIVSGYTKNCNLDYQSAGNLIRVTFSGVDAVSSDGTLVTFAFTAKAAGTATLQFTAYKMYDENGSSIATTNSSGKVTISEEISTGDIIDFSGTFKVMCSSKSAKSSPYGSSYTTRTVYRDNQLKVVGYVYNSYGNLWYKTDKGDYIHSTHLYAIDYNELPPSNYCNAQFEVKCPSKALKGDPKSSSDTLKTYLQGNRVNVTGYVYNEYGNLWYETSDGGYTYCSYLSLISSDERTPSNYLDIQMKVVASSKTLREDPYSKAESKGTVYQNNNVSIKGYLYNRYGNLWYITNNDCYIYSNYLQQINSSSLIPSNYIYANNAVTAEKDYKSEPYAVSDSLDTLASGKLINTVGYVINLFGNKWFECEDGGFIYDSSLAPAYYTVTYNANGGTGAPASQVKTYGQTLTLSSTKPTRTGYSFVGWATSDIATVAVYEPEAEFSIDENITLYAVWEKNVVLSSISIYCKPSKVTYYIGDSLNNSGLQLKLTYSDGSTKTVSSGFTTSGFSSTTAGTKTVNVSYEGKTTTFTVTVNTPSISLSSTSKSMTVGDTEILTATITPSGQTVTWTSSNTSVATVSNGKITAKAVGTATITAKFTYMGTPYSSTCLVTVSSSVLDCLSFTINNEEVTITGCDTSISGSLTIPDTINGYPVTAIGDFAFGNCISLESITIPSSVESIGYDAFCGYNNLTIYGYSGSFAESYARDNNIKFVALGEGDDKPVGTKIGDTNGDGKVTIADATQIQKHLANIVTLKGAELEAADTNGDGKVTIADATQIQKYLANLIPSLG